MDVSKAERVLGMEFRNMDQQICDCVGQQFDLLERYLEAASNDIIDDLHYLLAIYTMYQSKLAFQGAQTHIFITRTVQKLHKFALQHRRAGT